MYRFVECELDERLYQLRRKGNPVALEPKVFDVLVYLLQHRDRVVSKDELFDKLWPGQVVGENALTRCIRAARAAVGDDGTKQEIIETQHGRGYRFIGDVVSSQHSVLSSQEQSATDQAVSSVMPAQPVLSPHWRAGIQESQAEALAPSLWIPVLRRSSGQASAGMTPPPTRTSDCRGRTRDCAQSQ